MSLSCLFCNRVSLKIAKRVPFKRDQNVGGGETNTFGAYFFFSKILHILGKIHIFYTIISIFKIVVNFYFSLDG